MEKLKRYRITTPVAGHNEVIGTVAFANGEATVEADPKSAPIAYFRAQGYGVVEVDEKGEPVPVVDEPEETQEPADARDALIADLQSQIAVLRAVNNTPDPAAKPSKATAAKTDKEASA